MVETGIMGSKAYAIARHHQHMRYAWVRKVHAAGGTEQNEDGNVRAAGDVEQDEDAAQIIDRDNEHSQIDILKEEHSTQFSDQNRMKTTIARYRATRAKFEASVAKDRAEMKICLLYTSPSPRDQRGSRMPSSA